MPGWQRMALQILYFVPYDLLQPAASFSAISRKLLVSPVLKKLVFLNSPDEVLQVCRALQVGVPSRCTHMWS